MNLVPDVNAEHGRLLLLAPASAKIPRTFSGAETNPYRHASLLAASQRLRGRIYLEDKAIEHAELSSDGRYVQKVDEHSWHLLSLNGSGEICGCARYMSYPDNVKFDDTGVSRSPLSWSDEWGSQVRTAVESEIRFARRLGISYVEVGGWALTPEIRCTSEALRIALGMFSLARLLGGCIGMTTATRRHCSSSILRRIGGRRLTTNGVEIPRYFDPRYQCDMDILSFESALPNPRFEPWIEQLRTHLSTVPLVRGGVHIEQYVDRAAMTAA
jgi:hypothetical protein